MSGMWHRSGYEHLIVTDLWVGKEKTFDLANSDVERVAAEARRRLGAEVA